MNEKLSGKSLGAVEEGGDDDLKTWIKKTKKRERELAAKRAQELESQDNQYQDEYRAGMSLLFQADILEHLQGLTVGHDFDDIEQGEGVILTIKDRGILDDGGIPYIEMTNDRIWRRIDQHYIGRERTTSREPRQ